MVSKSPEKLLCLLHLIKLNCIPEHIELVPEKTKVLSWSPSHLLIKKVTPISYSCHGHLRFIIIQLVTPHQLIILVERGRLKRCIPGWVAADLSGYQMECVFVKFAQSGFHKYRTQITIFQTPKEVLLRGSSRDEFIWLQLCVNANY